MGLLQSIERKFRGALKGKPGYENTASGYNALPPEAQQNFKRFFDSLSAIPQDPYSTGRFSQVQAPQSPFDSEQLYALQQLMGDQGINPVGVLEPFNEYQRNALTSYGIPNYTEQGLSQYMAPFQAARERAAANINRYYDDQLGGIRSREARIGSLARDRDYGGQTPAVEEARMRAMLDAEAQATNAALNLRSNSLADMLFSGGMIQQQNQAGLNAASPQAINTYSPEYAWAQAYAPFLQAMPQAQSGNRMDPRKSTLGGIADLGNTLFGNSLQQWASKRAGLPAPISQQPYGPQLQYYR